MSAKKANEPKGPVEKFFRITEHELKAGDYFRGYQAEEITIQDDRVVGRKFLNKPDLFEYAQTHVVDLMDPRNSVTREAVSA